MKRPNETREKILASVEELIATRGVNNFSLRDICKNLYISTGSLYYHFKTKDDIILEIIEKHFEELEHDYIDWLERHKINEDLSKERFIDIIFYKGTELFNRSKIHLYLINECMRGNAKLKDRYMDLIHGWYDKLLDGVKQVYGDNENSAAMAYMLLAIIEGLTIRQALEDRRPKLEKEMKNILKGM